MQVWKSPPKFNGKLWLWRYRTPKRGWRGWHLSADPAGAQAFMALLDFLPSDDAAYRTLPLEPVSEALLHGVGYRQACERPFAKLRVACSDEVVGLELIEEEDQLRLTMGAIGRAELRVSLHRLATGEGDFALHSATTNGRVSWHFWWPPRADEHEISELK